MAGLGRFLQTSKECHNRKRTAWLPPVVELRPEAQDTCHTIHVTSDADVPPSD